MFWSAHVQASQCAALGFGLAQELLMRQLWRMIETPPEQVQQMPGRNPNLAPIITTENARTFAARSAEVRRAKRDRRLSGAEMGGNAPAPASDDARRVRCQRQVDVLLGSLERARTDEARFAIIAALEKLWRLVQPTAGVAKPARSARPAPPVVS